jgi:hypothetical protein
MKWIGQLEYPTLEAQRQKHAKIRISLPWDKDANHRVSNAWPHSTVLDIYTMISKIHLVGSISSARPSLAEFGSAMVSMMPLEVRDETGVCIGCVTLSPLREVNGMFEAIILAEKIAEFDASTEPAQAYWIMLIEWNGDLAQRTGFGLITVKGWHETHPEWRDIKLG